MHMPIVRKQKDTFVDSQVVSVRRIHRFAIVFGVVGPMLFLLVTSLKTGNVFSVWPTVLRSGIEHLYFYGWAGLYVFGLLAFLLPELIYVESTVKERSRLRVLTYVYGFGVLLMMGVAVGSFMWPSSHWSWVNVVAILAQAVAWILLLLQIGGFWRRHEEIVRVQGLVVLLGAVTVAIASVLRLITDNQVLLELLPLMGLGLITLGFLLRMIPELLGWRPVQDTQTKVTLIILLIATVMSALGYIGFHEIGRGITFFSTLSIVGGAGLFLGVAWLLLFMDLFHVRLAPLVNREHVPYIYASLAWLLLSAGTHWVGTVWEVVQGRALYEAWSEASIMAYFGGFVGLALMGMYTYWVNQTPSAYTHTDRLVTVALVLWCWVLALRVFVYPFAILSAWPGAFLFRWILDALLMLAIVMVSIDMYYGICGHPWRVRK